MSSRSGLSGQSLCLQALAVFLKGLLRLRVVAHLLLLGFDRLECPVGVPQRLGRGLISRHVDLDVAGRVRSRKAPDQAFPAHGRWGSTPVVGGRPQLRRPTGAGTTGRYPVCSCRIELIRHHRVRRGGKAISDDHTLPLFCPTRQGFFRKIRNCLLAKGLATVHGVVFPFWVWACDRTAFQTQKKAASMGGPFVSRVAVPLTRRPASAAGRARRICGSRRPGGR